MSTKTKSILRKIIYGILFLLMIVAFVCLSEKYASNSEEKILTISDYYSEIKSDKYETIKGGKLISLLSSGKHIIFIGSQTSDFSKKYIEELDDIINELDLDKIYYYDINADKAQKNSNYYEIRELLNGYLTTTDGSKNNLLAPSLYIIDEGEAKYYNIDTVAMKNTDTIEDYWNKEQEERFKEEITSAINKYYLNK